MLPISRSTNGFSTVDFASSTPIFRNSPRIRGEPHVGECGAPHFVFWGYTCIRGELFHVGHELGRTAIQRILSDHGIEPVAERKGRMRWKTFLKAHWEITAAAGFFTVEVPTVRGLVRYSVFFVIKLKTREVQIAGISPSPSGEWMKQLARNLTDAQDGFLGGVRYLILDRDPLYTTAFRAMIRDCSVSVAAFASTSRTITKRGRTRDWGTSTSCRSRRNREPMLPLCVESGSAASSTTTIAAPHRAG